ncbi:MAG TPA: hypothetical protein VHS79_01645 [Actinomycetes bacterium]|nr:hypothetical protein [Actinomycetes bacterium]
MVVAAPLAEPVERLQERLAALHRAVPMTGARLHRETWHPGPPPELVTVDGDPLDAPELVARFDLATEPPVRMVAGSGGTRVAVACHHAAFDGQSLVALLAALVRPDGPPDDTAGHLQAPQPPPRGVVDNRQHPIPASATLPLRGPEPRRPGLDRGRRIPELRVPELRGLVGRLVRPADRVAPSLARPVRETLAVAEVGLAGPGVTARLVAAAVAAAGAHNARLGRPWRRVGVNVGLAGPVAGGDRAGAHRPGGLAETGAGGPGRPADAWPPGNRSRYRRLDLRPGEPAGTALDAALARTREPLDQVWSPRFGWVLEPVVGRFSDSLLVSNLGRRAVPGVTRLEFFPVARGRSAVAVGAVGLAGGPATVSVRARDLSAEDIRALLADLVERLAAGP